MKKATYTGVNNMTKRMYKMSLTFKERVRVLLWRKNMTKKDLSDALSVSRMTLDTWINDEHPDVLKALK